MPSDNLQLDQLTGSEAEKIALINDIFQQLEDGLLESTTLVMADGNLTMTDAQFNRFVFYEVTSSPFTANRTLTLPTRKKLFVIHNQDTSLFRLKVQPAGGNVRSISAGQMLVLYSNGVTAFRLPHPSDVLAPALTGNWANTGGGWHNFGFERLAGSDVLLLRGTVQNTVDTMPLGNVITTLPVEHRPVADAQYVVSELSAPGNTAIVQVTSAGVVSVLGTPPVSSGIDLNGIVLR